MKLKKGQKEAVIKWAAEGLGSGEINDRAACFDPPFEVSRAQVDYYRKTRKLAIDAIIEASENSALREGLALRGIRVEKLKRLAHLMEHDLIDKGLLWVDDVKGVGSGDAAEVVDFEKFNAAEIAAYRGVLEDIAKEVGHRVQRQEVKSEGRVTVEYINDWRDNQAT
jgi:hypothetical protein